MIDRRELFKIFAATVAVAREEAGQHLHDTPATVDTEGYKPRFFSGQEYAVIDELTEIIIPTDNQSPGAHAAGVRFYIDTVLHYAEPEVQEKWRAGLAAVEEASRAQFAKSFSECNAAEKDQVVALMARNEKAPATDLERFFPVLKSMALEAFVLSEIGKKEYLGYRGDTALQEFRGCTHPEHQRV